MCVNVKLRTLSNLDGSQTKLGNIKLKEKPIVIEYGATDLDTLMDLLNESNMSLTQILNIRRRLLMDVNKIKERNKSHREL